MSTETITRRNLIAGAAAAGALAASARATAQSAELTDLTIEEAARRIAAGELSTARAHARVSRAHRAAQSARQRLHHRDRRAALAQARALGAELAAGRSRGPLHGIPIALKDNIDTAGIRTTAASAVYADRVPTEDAPVVTQAARRGRRVPRQAQHARVRVRRHVGHHALRARAQSVESAITRRAVPRAAPPRPSLRACAPPRSARIRPHRSAFPPRAAASWASRPRMGLRAFAASCRFGDARSRGTARAQRRRRGAGDDGACRLRPARSREHRRADARTIDAAIGRDVSALRIGMPRTPFFERLDPEIDAAVNRALGVLGAHAVIADVELPAVDAFRGARLPRLRVPRGAASPIRARARFTSRSTLGTHHEGANMPSTTYIEARRRMIIARNTIGAIFETCRRARHADVDAHRPSRSLRRSRTRPERAPADPQHAAVQRLRHSDDQRALRLHAPRVADRLADQRAAAGRGARAGTRACVRAGDGLASARATALGSVSR